MVEPQCNEVPKGLAKCVCCNRVSLHQVLFHTFKYYWAEE